MAAQWYYRMFGHDFGPIEFEELKLLARQGALTQADEVRDARSSHWVAAGTVSELALEELTVSASARSVGGSPPATATTVGNDDWFCQFHGQELGPLGFDDIVAFAEQGQLTAEDEVKLGSSGKWRRVGSIGRLVAVLPFNASVASPVAGKKLQPPALTSKPVAVSEKPVAVSEPTTPRVIRTPVPTDDPMLAAAVAAAMAKAVAEAGLAAAHASLEQAQAAYTTADRNARGLIQWAVAPNIDPGWWCWIAGVEYGPLGFPQVYELGISGRLQATDFVKNGMFGQYVPAANLPGFFNAVSEMQQAATVLIAAKAGVETATLEVARAEQVTKVTTAFPSPPETAPGAAAGTAPGASASADATPVTPSPIASQSIGIASTGEGKTTIAATTAATAATTGAATAPAVLQATSRPANSGAAVSSAVTPSAAIPSGVSSDFGSMSSGSASAGGAPFAPSSASPAMSTIRPSKPPGKPLSEYLEDPKAKGVLGLVAAALLVGVWMILPENTGKDIERYQVLKKFLDDVRVARRDGKDMSPFKSRADQLVNEIVPSLRVEASNRRKGKQNLLWAARDELPKMVAGNLMTESQPEKNFESRLNAAAKYFRIK